MKNKEYTAEELALDPAFRKWVLAPTADLDAQWRRWMTEDVERQKIAEEARGLIREAGLVLDEEANEKYLEVWQSLQQNIRTSALSHSERSAGVRTLMAAVVSLLVIAGAWFFFFDNTKETIVSTGYNEVKKLVLPDGSSVAVNGNSTLRYASSFPKEGERKVYLEGEAFFEVAKGAEGEQFVVHASDGVEIRVLGTRFNLKTKHSKVMLYLQEGVVLMSSDFAKVELSPGQLAEFDTEKQLYNANFESSQSEEMILDWTRSLFSFNDVPLSQVIDELEETFGVTVVVKDPVLLNRRITAKIPRSDLDVVVEVLSATLEINIDTHGKQLVISGR